MRRIINLAALCAALLAPGARAAGEAPATIPPGRVLLARVSSVISPVSARFISEAIDRAEAENSACLVIELDTPGGLDDSMRTIIKRILAARTPVVVYVSPAGSRAASAGAFITMAAHVAAMAPGTAIGAAHPVSLMQHASFDTNMSSKVTHDAAAYIRSIAEKRGRNVAWAESAVRESVSLSETEALKQKVIDLIAPSTTALLEAIDGRTVALNGGTVRLNTRNAKVDECLMSSRDRFLEVIANPNIAYILFMVGLLGLYFELATPGAILPGVAGAICLILSFFAFQMLPVNYAGIILILLGIILLIVDVKAGTHGVLTAGGLIAMFIGSLMLFDYDDPALKVSLRVIVPVVLAIGLFFLLGTWLSIRALVRKPASGALALIGETGDARTAVDADGGQVFAAGAYWNAVSDAPIAAGSRIVVKGVSGMTLKVSQANRQ